MMVFLGMLLLVNIVTGIGIPYVWERLMPYQQARILSFFEPSRDAFGTGYQAIQSKVAIGSGGLFGTHYLQGTQKGLALGRPKSGANSVSARSAYASTSSTVITLAVVAMPSRSHRVE